MKKTFTKLFYNKNKKEFFNILLVELLGTGIILSPLAGGLSIAMSCYIAFMGGMLLAIGILAMKEFNDTYNLEWKAYRLLETRLSLQHRVGIVAHASNRRFAESLQTMKVNRRMTNHEWTQRAF